MSRRTKFSTAIWIALLCAALISSAVSAAAGHPAPQTQSGIGPDLPATGNYCGECHSANDLRVQSAAAWKGTVGQNTSSACPAANTIREELFYTERILLAINNSLSDLPQTTSTTKLEERLAASTESYQRLLDEPVTSLSAFQSNAQMLRYRLGKIVTEISNQQQAAKKTRVLVAAGLVTLIILGSLIWGYRNAQRGIQAAGSQAAAGQFGFKPGHLAAIALIFALFALPIFKIPVFPAAEATAQQQAVQAVLDTSGRAAETAGRAQAKVWMLGSVGSVWAEVDPTSGEQVLQEARRAAQAAEIDSVAIWGDRQAAVEASAGSDVEQKKAALVAEDLASAHSRAWGLRLAAGAWVDRDPQAAETLLAAALSTAEQAQGIYRDLDLRGIAVEWAYLDLRTGQEIITRVQDPALRSWGMREIAQISGSPDDYQQAAESAFEVSDPIQRARLLREIGFASGDEAYFDQALATLKDYEGANDLDLAYALASLASAWNRPDLLSCEAPETQAACATGYLALGDFPSAWEAAGQMSDPFDQARAQAEIAAAWQNTEAASQIQIPYLQERVIRDIAITNQDINLAATLSSPYLQVQAWSRIGDYARAWEIAPDLTEKYPLVGLATAEMPANPEEALQAVDLLEKEADKSIVLLAASVLNPQDGELFGRALNMALAGRVRGDSLSPARASLYLAIGLEKTNPELAAQAFSQAYEAALKVVAK